MQKLSLSLLLIITLLMSFASCTEKPTAVIQDKQEFTIDDQKIIGNYLADAIRSTPSQYDVLDDTIYAVVYEYLNKMLATAVITEQVVLRKEFTWEIIPIEDNLEPYVYSMPGGKIVISTAMLQFMNYESELLAILSNEIYFADVDLHSIPLRDEFTGIRLGSIALGSETKDPSDMIDFLKNQRFTEADVMQADMRTVSVLCPFNYDMGSLPELVARARVEESMEAWNIKRPRSADWYAQITTESEKCENPGSDRFQSRYEEIKAQLPE